LLSLHKLLLIGPLLVMSSWKWVLSLLPLRLPSQPLCWLPAHPPLCLAVVSALHSPHDIDKPANADHGITGSKVKLHITTGLYALSHYDGCQLIHLSDWETCINIKRSDMEDTRNVQSMLRRLASPCTLLTTALNGSCSNENLTQGFCGMIRGGTDLSHMSL